MKFIKEVANGSYKTNLFGANGTEITVKNSKNNIVGMGKANSDGSFSIPVENDNFYSVEINFKSKKAERKLSKDNLNNLEVDLGRFQGEEILGQ
ncbi:MAG TPA: hypothetical protein DCE56_17855 [Cyanobacteria bacterium UBA8553]|nr:hypothetical protein [Cyanobacteria bacterium UBA8553]HAJ58279.1 hypothetical protein [Cyanobacteria bacterium UBA8543]